ncbi:hypothetical protein BCL69_10836 [Nitrosomonas communis]|uniref:Uncharacterized protein n=1 Tax=Nitrosomonas communis TaxID=44574 RepID=A0A5D3YA42_9PROT|nr:hypothetical protein BCL69_10836 [Nitrosomonas communis]
MTILNSRLKATSTIFAEWVSYILTHRRLNNSCLGYRSAARTLKTKMSYDLELFSVEDFVLLRLIERNTAFSIR